MSSHSYGYRTPQNQSGAFAKMAAVLLGLLVAVFAFFALLMWLDARDRGSGTPEAAPAAAEPRNHATDHNTALPLNSFAQGQARTRRRSPPRTNPTTRRCRRFRRATS